MGSGAEARNRGTYRACSCDAVRSDGLVWCGAVWCGVVWCAQVVDQRGGSSWSGSQKRVVFVLAGAVARELAAVRAAASSSSSRYRSLPAPTAVCMLGTLDPRPATITHTALSSDALRAQCWDRLSHSTAVSLSCCLPSSCARSARHPADRRALLRTQNTHRRTSPPTAQETHVAAAVAALPAHTLPAQLRAWWPPARPRHERNPDRPPGRGAVSAAVHLVPDTPANGQGSHKAILAYLGVLNAPNTAAAFREEANVSDAFDDATRRKYEGLLEKKWTSVVRLQKKVDAPQEQRLACC